LPIYRILSGLKPVRRQATAGHPKWVGRFLAGRRQAASRWQNSIALAVAQIPRSIFQRVGEVRHPATDERIPPGFTARQMSGMAPVDQLGTVFDSPS